MNMVDGPEFECMIGTSTAARCRRNETKMELKITETQAEAYLDAIFTAHLLLINALRKLENNQMISGKPVCDKTKTLIKEIELLEELGGDLQSLLDGD